VSTDRDRTAATLVFGLPGLTATRVAEGLVARGESVLGLLKAGGRVQPPSGVEVIAADPVAIDLGLAGPDYLELCARATRVVYAVDPVMESGSLERATTLRIAAELLELLRAGAGKQGVVFLSSLFVFGDAKGPVAESEFEVGQDHPAPLEEALAIAEKLVRRAERAVPLSVVRAAPVAGDAERHQLSPSSPLARLAERIRLSPGAFDVEFSDQPVRFETADRLANVLLRCWEAPRSRTLHLVDREPLSDRQLVTWLAARIGRPLSPPTSSMRLRQRLRLSETSLARSILGYPTTFERSTAEDFCADLLDPDTKVLLEAFFSPQLSTPGFQASDVLRSSDSREDIS